MITLFRRLPSHVPLVRFDDTVTYCLTLPVDNQLIDVEYACFGGCHTPRKHDTWMIVEKHGDETHIHYVRTSRGKYKNILTSVYKDGKLITNHVPFDPGELKYRHVPQTWSAKTYTTNCIIQDDKKLNETAYFEAMQEYLSYMNKQKRLELWHPGSLIDFNDLCLRHHSEPNWIQRANLSDLYKQHFGNPNLDIVPNSPLTRHFTENKDSEVDGHVLNRHLSPAAVVVEDQVDPDITEATEKGEPIITRVDVRSGDKMVVTGNLVMYLLECGWGVINLTLVTHSKSSEETGLYITKAEASKDLVIGTETVTKKSPVTLFNDLKSHLKIFLDVHLGEDVKRVKSIQFTFKDMTGLINVVFDDKKTACLVIPILDLIESLPVFEFS